MAALRAVGLSILIELLAGLLAAGAWVAGVAGDLTWRSCSRSGSALAYGLSDFVGGVASKRVSPWSVALGAQLAGAVAVLALSLTLGGSPTGADLAWAVVGGLGNGLRHGVPLPRARRRPDGRGRPGLRGRRRPGAGRGRARGRRAPGRAWSGSASSPRCPASGWSPASRAPAPAGAGVGDGVLAGLGFGTLFAALAQIPAEAGFLPLALNQVVGGLTIVAVATALRRPWLPRDPRAGLGAVSGAARRARHGRLPARHATTACSRSPR